MTRKEVVAKIVEATHSIYGEREAHQIARIVLEDLCDISWSSYIINSGEECVVDNLDYVLHELSIGRPIQQIVG